MEERPVRSACVCSLLAGVFLFACGHDAEYYLEKGN